MPISIQLIREDVAPIIEKIDTFRFIGGEARKMAIQLLNSYNRKPNFIPSGWAAMVTLPTADAYNPLNYLATQDSTDPSVIYTQLAIGDTYDLISGRIKVSLIYITDPNANTIVSSITPNSYTASTGAISVPDSVDLDGVFPGMIFEDSTSAKFLILGVNDVTGAKEILIGENLSPSTAAGAAVLQSTNALIAIRDNVFTKTRL